MADTRPPQQQASRRFWLVAVAVFVLLIAVAGYIQWRMAQAPDTTGPSAYQPPLVTPEVSTIEEVGQYTAGRPIPPVSTTDSAGEIGPNPNLTGEHIRGNPEARISIVEYANLTSNYGRLIQPELVKIINANPDVNWIFRHYPQPNNEMDYPLAYISECVFRQTSNAVFWQFIDQIYSERPKTVMDALAMAGAWVEDNERLQTCYGNTETEKAVKDHKRLGYFYGNVRVLPTFIFVDKATGQERVVTGVDTPSFLQRVVDTMLEVEA